MVPPERSEGEYLSSEENIQKKTLTPRKGEGGEKIMELKLNHLYTLDQIASIPELFKSLEYCYRQYTLPTEVVITDNRPVLLNMGRCYRTSYYLNTKYEIIYEYKKIIKNDYEVYANLYLIEHYENVGDDGHVDFRIQGYVLISDKTAKAIVFSNINVQQKLSNLLYDTETQHLKEKN